MINAQSADSNEEVNVVMQLSRAKWDLVRLIRQDARFRQDTAATNEEDRWNGVRRYYIGRENSTLLNKLGNTNMADPESSYSFIKWGMSLYPAGKYILKK